MKELKPKNMWWFIYWRMQLWCMLFMGISGGIIGVIMGANNYLVDIPLFMCDVRAILTPIMLIPSLILAFNSWNKYQIKMASRVEIK